MDPTGLFIVAGALLVHWWKRQEKKKQKGLQQLLNTSIQVLEVEMHGFPCRILRGMPGRIELELQCPAIPLEFRSFQGERAFSIGDPDFDGVVALDGEPGMGVAILGTEERSFVRAFVRIGGRLEAGTLRLEVQQMEEVERRLELMARLATLLLAQQPEIPGRLLLWLEDPFHPHRIAAFRTVFRHWPARLSPEHWRRYLTAGAMEFRWAVASLAGPELREHLPDWGIPAWLPLALMGRPELQESAFGLLKGHPEGWHSLQRAMEVAPAPALVELALRWNPSGPEVEQLLVTALKATPADPEWLEPLRERALRLLETRGSVGAVESLLPLSRTPGPFGRRVTEVIRSIQARIPGALPGQLSLVEGTGDLSLAEGSGELSLVEEGRPRRSPDPPGPARR